MKFISSDTNFWIDFVEISRLEWPFLLDYTYLMNNDAIEDELLEPEFLREKLIQLGLQSTELSFEEFLLAEEYGLKYKRLTRYDRIALAIAKNRNILLLTGDRNLRKAADLESVKCIGTIGIVDHLFYYKKISEIEYEECIKSLINKNGSVIRLPKEELEKRLDKTLRNHIINSIVILNE
ncbi:MAG: PIN domain-containing protein [Bacilli bacterium]